MAPTAWRMPSRKSSSASKRRRWWAFAISEMADWAIFSFTGRPLQQRILISSLFSVPLDTLSFLYLAGFLTPASFGIQILSKAVGVMVVWYLLKLRTGGTPATAH